MKITLTRLLLFSAILSINIFTAKIVHAAGTVGTGTSASCTDAALNTALTGGGAVIFNCGGAATITLLTTKDITTDTQIDGGGLITLSGGNTVRLFTVQAGATLTLSNITISNGNSGAANGGGMLINSGAAATISNSAFSNNTTAATVFPNGGGAIYNEGTLTITGSAFFSNTATGFDGDGGAIESFGANSSLSTSNSTFYNNTAGASPLFTNGVGGAINIRDSGGTNTLTQVTFSNNTNQAPYGTLDVVNSSATVTNSIFANSVTGFDCSKRFAGTLTSTNNLIENDSTTGPCTAAVATDPGLGTFQNNGGLTQTMAITNASPAYNYTASCPSTTDQRGVARPQPAGGNCDIGAYELDNTAPSVTIDQAIGQADPTNGAPINFTVVFSEPVTGFTTGDVSFTGSTVGGVLTGTVSGGPTTYTVAVTGMTTAGIVVASVPAGVVTDIGLINNTASTSTDNTVTYDATGPFVTIDQAAGQADPTSGATINFTVVFSEATTNFATGDVSFTGSTVGGTLTGTVSGGPTTFNVAVTGMTTSGNVVATVPAGVATDALGNNNSASTSTDNTVTYDATGPGVTINQAIGQADPTSGSTINFTVVFSEPTTNFVTGDVNLSGTAGATSAIVTQIAPNDGTTYNVAVSGMTGDGTVIANILAGVATDALGNGNSASTSADNNVTFDTTGPALAIGPPGVTITTTGPVTFPITITNATTINLTAGNVTLNTTGTATGTVTITNGTTANPTVTINATTGSGTIGISIAAGVASDGVGNTSAAAGPSATFIVDNGGPVVTASVPANTATVPGPNQLIVTYNEDVKNDGSAGAANNVANYLLVEAGVNTVFDTLNCLGSVVADDVAIAVNTATYNNNGGAGPFTATLGINGGAALPVGVYQLYVCGTTSVEDLASNELNNGAADTIIQFTVTAAAGGGGAGTQRAASMPATGFPQGELSSLPIQPANMAYTATNMWIEIPALHVKMSIVGVPQAKDGWDVTWLGKDAGWLNGSAFPTWNGNSVITGHVWDALNKPGPFALLKELKYGDQVKIHAFGQVFIYEIRESKLVSPANTKAMLKHEEKSWLTLITCEEYREKSQTYSYRRMVRAVLISVIEDK